MYRAQQCRNCINWIARLYLNHYIHQTYFSMSWPTQFVNSVRLRRHIVLGWYSDNVEVFGWYSGGMPLRESNTLCVQCWEFIYFKVFCRKNWLKSASSKWDRARSQKLLYPTEKSGKKTIMVSLCEIYTWEYLIPILAHIKLKMLYYCICNI